MKILIASLLSLIFLFLSGIHIYWGVGGKSPSITTVPTKENNKPVISPGPLGCLIVATGLFAVGIFALIKAGMISFYLPQWLLNYGLWAIAALFLVRAIGDFKYIGIFKKVQNTKFAKMDARYYSPLCFFLSFLAIILEIIA